MTEPSSGSMRTLLQKVGIGKDTNTSESSKAQKAHRRAQVRKAQTEHRLRKQNHVKHLEQDVIRLRAMISALETECTAFEQENLGIRTVLFEANISASSVLFQPSQVATLSDFNFEFQSPEAASPSSGSEPSTTIASIGFDHLIEAHCLHVNPRSEFNQPTILNSPDIFNFPTNAFSVTTSDAATNSPSQGPFSQPSLDSKLDSNEIPSRADTSDIAINFILALEHPCRTHFHPSTAEFDPTGNPSGHELMASTLLYSHAPVPTFNNFDSPSWPVPSMELSQLWNMSLSLPREDWEITPVQAWFLLAARYDVNNLLGNGGSKLNGLKQRLAKLVGCYSFGAMMDEEKFWTAVTEVMGNQ